MENEFNFDEIRPYDDSQVHAAFERACAEPEFKNVLGQIFTHKPADEIIKHLLQIQTVDQFQREIMAPYFLDMIEKTADSMSINGLDKISKDDKYLYISNHRDIIVDAALLSSLLVKNGVPASENAIGDNLCSRPWITEIMKLNRNFLVKRSGSKREIFESSRRMSAYIRMRITKKESSIWIAQREGRAKDSNDFTQESVLKMLSMSGENFKQGFIDLNILPVSISYEYDACDYLKAKEFLCKHLDPEFKKSANDDVHNMRVGLTDYKGNVHYEVAGTINEEIDREVNDDDDRATAITKVARIIDRNIFLGYKFFSGNYVAYDERFGTDRFAKMYSSIEKNTFDEYIASKIEKIEMEGKDEEFLRQRMLEMYSNTLVNKLSVMD